MFQAILHDICPPEPWNSNHVADCGMDIVTAVSCEQVLQKIHHRNDTV